MMTLYLFQALTLLPIPHSRLGVREEQVFSLSCVLPREFLMEVHHLFIKVSGLFRNDLKLRHVTFHVLPVVEITQFSCGEGWEEGREGWEGGEGGRGGGREEIQHYMYVHAHACTCIHTYAHVPCIHIHTCMYIHAHVCMYVHTLHDV